MRLSDLKISYKIISVIIMLASVAIISSVISAQKMREMDDLNTKMVDVSAYSAVGIVKINRILAQYEGNMFETILLSDEGDIKPLI